MINDPIDFIDQFISKDNVRTTIDMNLGELVHLKHLIQVDRNERSIEHTIRLTKGRNLDTINGMRVEHFTPEIDWFEVIPSVLIVFTFLGILIMILWKVW